MHYLEPQKAISLSRARVTNLTTTPLPQVGIHFSIMLLMDGEFLELTKVIIIYKQLNFERIKICNINGRNFWLHSLTQGIVDLRIDIIYKLINFHVSWQTDKPTDRQTDNKEILQGFRYFLLRYEMFDKLLQLICYLAIAKTS